MYKFHISLAKTPKLISIITMKDNLKIFDNQDIVLYFRELGKFSYVGKEFFS